MILADCDKARQYLLMALDNLDTIERTGRRADILQATAVTARLMPGNSLAEMARKAWGATAGAIEVLNPKPQEEEG